MFSHITVTYCIHILYSHILFTYSIYIRTKYWIKKCVFSFQKDTCIMSVYCNSYTIHVTTRKWQLGERLINPKMVCRCWGHGGVCSLKGRRALHAGVAFSTHKHIASWSMAYILLTCNHPPHLIFENTFFFSSPNVIIRSTLYLLQAVLTCNHRLTSHLRQFSFSFLFFWNVISDCYS